MTFDNHDPLANPLNKARYQYAGLFKSCPNATLPQSDDMFCPIVQSGTGRVTRASDLHVPNQDIPTGGVMAGNGFLGKSPFFRCMDGTVLNMQTRTIVHRPDETETKILNYSKTSGDWNNKDIFTLDPMKSKDDWSDTGFIRMQVDKVKQEVGRLSAEMTPEQHAWLDAFEADHTDSRWVDESRKSSGVKYKLIGG